MCGKAKLKQTRIEFDTKFHAEMSENPSLWGRTVETLSFYLLSRQLHRKAALANPLFSSQLTRIILSSSRPHLRILFSALRGCPLTGSSTCMSSVRISFPRILNTQHQNLCTSLRGRVENSVEEILSKTGPYGA